MSYAYVIIYQVCHGSTSNMSPRFTEIESRRSQNVATSFKIFCSPSEGSKPLRFEWYKNGLALLPFSNIELSYRIETSEDESIFKIDKLSPGDSGNYSCLTLNTFGSDTQFTILTVKGLHTFSHCFDHTTIVGAI